MSLNIKDLTTNKPRRNIFNIFEKGKDFFILRTVITGISAMALIIGVLLLAEKSWEVYPTVVRDHRGNTFVGTGKTYNPEPIELLRMVKAFTESAYTKTEKGLNLDALAPYASRNAVAAFANIRERLGVFTQTASMFDFFLGSAIGPDRRVVYTQIEVTRAGLNGSVTDTAYLAILLKTIPRNNENPTGWMIEAVEDLSRRDYLQMRRRFVQDALSAPVGASDLINIENTINN